MITDNKYPITEIAEKEQESIKKLIKSLDRINRNLGFWRSFLRGIMVALGSTIGFALAIALISYVLHFLSFIPGIQNLIDALQNIMINVKK